MIPPLLYLCLLYILLGVAGFLAAMAVCLDWMLWLYRNMRQ